MRKGIVAIVLVWGLVGYCHGQDWNQDLERLNQETHEGNTHAAAATGKAPFQPVQAVMNAALTVYQRVFSLQLSTNCIYELSCSRFSREAIRQYGPLKGVVLTADRITRCNGIHYNETSRLRRNAEGKVIDLPEAYTLRH
ncbi:MAG TPA: hypothetical protein DCE41_10225 [Cytophagales bacterium]|nr:hypothetical protein [Cytophagales bacterium]HAA19347.1 hypothetical protein [Cytophagales bacterium]HAP59834.1 hypothetical protein [Cytophagales bacterium]